MQILFSLMLVVACLFGSTGALLAQTGDRDAERAVIDAVQAQLRYLGDRDIEALAETFTDTAIIVVSRRRDGRFTNSVTRAENWLASMRANPDAQTFEERISNVHVTIDSGHLAHVRADFEILRGGTVVSSGIDQFTLVREPEGWKVAVIAYTSIPAEIR